MIGFDYSFDDFSLEYGKFIVAALEGYPEGKIEKVTHHYPFKDNRVIVYFKAPTDISVLLKLQFGNRIVDRPQPQSFDKDKALYERIRDLSKKNLSNCWDFENEYINPVKYMKISQPISTQREIDKIWFKNMFDDTDGLADYIKKLDE